MNFSFTRRISDQTKDTEFWTNNRTVCCDREKSTGSCICISNDLQFPTV